MRIAVALAVLLLLGCSTPEPRPPDLAPAEWKAFGQGAWVRMRSRSFSPRGRLTLHGMEAVFVASVETLVGEPVLATSSERRRPIRPRYEDPGWKKVRLETLDLAGRSVICDVFEGADPHVRARLWVAQDRSAYPDPILKSEEGPSTSQVGAWEETLKAAGREFRCVRYDFTFGSENPVSRFEGRSWYSREVPGHVVKTSVLLHAGARQEDEIVDYAPGR
jgi:hypothetical protein